MIKRFVFVVLALIVCGLVPVLGVILLGLIIDIHVLPPLRKP